MCLKDKGKLGYIDGRLPEPNGDALDLDVYTKNNSMVLAWRRNSITTEILESCAHAKRALELWESLKKQYGKSNVVSIF